MLKPVLLCGLLTLAAALRATEGSGGQQQLSDMEDLEDVQEEGGLLEGSGGDEDEWSFLSQVPPAVPAGKKNKKTSAAKSNKKKAPALQPGLTDSAQFDYDIHLSKLDGGNEATTAATEKAAAKKTDDLYEYYDDLYPEEYKDLTKNYESANDDRDEDYNYGDSSDFDRDSVLKIDEKGEAGDIEIKPRPEDTTTEEAILETSQIFIMVGSAFVSFAIVMLTFFMCRRAMAKKRAKKASLAFAYTAPDGPATRTVKESSIVKDYQKVPTSTRELLQYQSTRIDMYREGGEPAASAPLVKEP